VSPCCLPPKNVALPRRSPPWRDKRRSSPEHTLDDRRRQRTLSADNRFPGNSMLECCLGLNKHVFLDAHMHEYLVSFLALSTLLQKESVSRTHKRPGEDREFVGDKTIAPWLQSLWTFTPGLKSHIDLTSSSRMVHARHRDMCYHDAKNLNDSTWKMFPTVDVNSFFSRPYLQRKASEQVLVIRNGTALTV
jgi:hypothetical protein